MAIISCMVPEIWRATDRIFLSFWTIFLPFYPTNNSQNQNFQKANNNTWSYYYFTHMYHKWQSYDEWFLRCGVPRTKCFVILDCFLLFYPPNNAEKPNLEKIKKNRQRAEQKRDIESLVPHPKKPLNDLEELHLHFLEERKEECLAGHMSAFYKHLKYIF